MHINNESEMVSGLSDIGYCTSSPEKSICFPGPDLLGNRRLPYVQELTRKFLELNIADATVNHLGATWRCHKDSDVVDGVWVRFRRTPDIAPSFDQLKVRLPQAVTEFLLSAEHNKGGLILILGAAGTGKTTTASATVVSRLKHFGGYCQTVEEPPEYPLNGWHERGYCTQTWVKESGPNAWADAMKNALRSQAVGTPGMLFLGEVREDAAAKIALVAATNGFLVICTSFATSVESGISSFADRLEDSQIPMFSKMLRGVVYQNMLSNLFSFQLLVVDQPVELMIVTKKYNSLHGELTLQNNKRRMEGTVNPNSGVGIRPHPAAQAPLTSPSVSAPGAIAQAAPEQRKIGAQNMLFDISASAQTAPAPASAQHGSVPAPTPLPTTVAPSAPLAQPAVAPSSSFAAVQMPEEDADQAPENFEPSGFVDSRAFHSAVKREAPQGKGGWLNRFLKK